MVMVAVVMVLSVMVAAVMVAAIMVAAIMVVGNLWKQNPAAVEISFLAKSQHASRPPGCV
jgi:hypothetical protein